MRKYLTGLLAAATVITGIAGGASSALAATPQEIHLSVSPDIGSNYTADIDVDSSDFTNSFLLGLQKADHAPHVIQLGSGLIFSGNSMNVDGVDITHISGLSDIIAELRGDHTYDAANIASATSTLAGFATSISSINNWFNTMGTTTINVATASATGLISSTNQAKLDGLVKVQRTRVTTDGSGNYTWTFPTAYPSGQAPVVSVIAEDSSSALSNVQVTSISNTSVTVHAGKITSALGILSLASNASVPVDITAVPQ